MSVYLQLTREFNVGRVRAIVCSGQAVVLHRLAIMSKDGDWILREDEEALTHVLRVLDRNGARYRFGAPLALDWMRGAWSAHFEYRNGPLRVRTDFFTRPPRVSPSELSRLWNEQQHRDPPFVDARTLAEMKKTNREKDWAVIGELARLLPEARDKILLSRSARDLQDLAAGYPELVAELQSRRALLGHLSEGRDEIERRLDEERRASMHANERRLAAYMKAASPWANLWSEVARETEGLSLLAAHARIVERATGVLPCTVEEAP